MVAMSNIEQRWWRQGLILSSALIGFLVAGVAGAIQNILLWPGNDHDQLFDLALLLFGLAYSLGFAIILASTRQLPKAPWPKRIGLVAVVLSVFITLAATYLFPELARPGFEARHRHLIESLHGSARPCATFLTEQGAHPLPSVAGMRAPSLYTDDTVGGTQFILAYAMHPDYLGGSSIYYVSDDSKWQFHHHTDCDCCTQTCPSVALRNTLARMKECVPGATDERPSPEKSSSKGDVKLTIPLKRKMMKIPKQESTEFKEPR